jgi:peptidoglycan/LPS O-acetylase OafA/YrhL
MRRFTWDRRRIGSALVVAGTCAVAVSLAVFFYGPFWRGNGTLFLMGVVAGLVGLGLQGRSGPGLVLIGLGALFGFGAWFVYELTMASEAYPPDPLWPAYVIAAVAVVLVIVGAVLLVWSQRGKRRAS